MTKTFKSIFNGLGTGSGMAWPLFGIVFSLIGSSISSMVSLTFAATTVGFFAAVTSTVIYLSYKEMQEQQDKQALQLEKNKVKLCNYLNEFLLVAKKNHQLNASALSFDAYLTHYFNGCDKATREPLLALMLYHAIRDKPIPLESLIPLFIQNQLNNLHPVPLSKQFTQSFLGFAGTFSSIAGCAAGVSGLLTGIGLFSSFAAFPVLGWGVLAVALVMGIIATAVGYFDAQKQHQTELLTQSIKLMNKCLKKEVAELNSSLIHCPKSINTEQAPLNYPTLFNKLSSPTNADSKTPTFAIELQSV